MFDPAQPPRLRIGLVNNMPDSAYAATERQFETLVREAAGDRPIELVRFHFHATPRSELAAAALAVRSRPASDIVIAGLDAVIVTGAEPKAAHLNDEPYWAEFKALTDYVRATRLPAVWSCLATHAALLHVVGIARRRRDTKLSGVFSFSADPSHPFNDGAKVIRTPHSRWNALPLEDLHAAGAHLLSVSEHTGADTFTLDAMPGSLFLQGHPEYDSDTLAREYRRDINRYLAGEQAFMPSLPANLFDYDTELALKEMTAAGPDSELLGALDKLLASPVPTPPWRNDAVALYRMWLNHSVLSQQPIVTIRGNYAYDSRHSDRLHRPGHL